MSMIAGAADYDDLPLKPECAAALDVLNRWLDRETLAVPPDVANHVAACPDCGGRFAASGQLSAALAGDDSAPVPPDLTERIVADVLFDFRRRRRSRVLSIAGAALAAGVALAIWLTRPAPPAVVPEVVQNTASPVSDLRQELADAGEAVAAVTRQAAADAVEAGRDLVPAIPPTQPPTLGPVRPLEDAGTALADGFEPVATSARRAARLFWREFTPETSRED
jgi:hypothetical protein